MDEGQFLGMEKLTCRLIASQVPQFDILTRAVGVVADNGVADMMEMHADLVGASGIKIGFDESGVFESFQHAETSPGFASFVRHGHFLPLRFVTSNRAMDFAGVFWEAATHDGAVRFLHRSTGKLFG